MTDSVHECVFVEEQEPEGRLILPPCLVCGCTAMDALNSLRVEAKREALSEAADAWQWGQWADAPRCADRVQERIANGQFVTDWLRARASSVQ